MPFLNIARINRKDRYANGNLKRMIRLLKTIQKDTEEKIELTDYELSSVLYNMNIKKYNALVGICIIAVFNQFYYCSLGIGEVLSP